MAKNKNSTYVSKGQRPNVSRKTQKAVRTERKASNDVRAVLQRDARRSLIKSSYSKEDKILAERYKEEDKIHIEASRLYNKYSKAGLTWSAAVQAVKTDFVESLNKKWVKRLRSWNEEQRKNKTLLAT